jgi:hypothetical protein
MEPENRSTQAVLPAAVLPSPRLLDRQGWTTLVAGALLLLISYFTNVGDCKILRFSSLPATEAVGIYLHLAALAALVGDVELATHLRHRVADRAAEEGSFERKKRLQQLLESNARIARYEQELFSSSIQPPSTGDSSLT